MPGAQVLMAHFHGFDCHDVDLCLPAPSSVTRSEAKATGSTGVAEAAGLPMKTLLESPTCNAVTPTVWMGPNLLLRAGQ